MEYGQLDNISPQFGMIELESSISATLSVLPICSEEECSAGLFPKQRLVIEPSWKFHFKLLLIKGMWLIYDKLIVSHLSLLFYFCRCNLLVE